MSKIDELIQELCPDGVEFKLMVDVVDVLYGYPLKSELFTDDSNCFPLIRIRDVVPGTVQTYYSGTAPEKYIIKKGDILVGMDGEFNLKKWTGPDAYLNQRTLRLSTKDPLVMIDGFIEHYMGPVFKKVEARIQGSTVKHLSAKVINSLKIPVPPMGIQEEIVRILDSFTELEKELEKELSFRQKQYEYYRDDIFKFEANEKTKLGRMVKELYPDEVAYLELKDVVKIVGGKDYKHLDVGDVPVYGSGGVMTYVDTPSACGPTVLLPRKGSISNVFYVDGPFWNVDTIFSTDINEELINPRYFYYFILNERIEKYNTSNAARPALTRTVLERIKVPVPSMEIQEEVVRVLDDFYALTNDISIGLPAEIEARHKQYEHYRDKLLTFEEKVS